ncbi:MAG TPA: response regulator [Candidatus Paceibacterota bacterium]
MVQNTKQQKKILIVEDEEGLRDIIASELEKEGISVLRAKDGEEGLQLAFQEQPDLILLDVLMPNVDGLTMLEKLRENRWGKNAKVIILTNAENDVEKVAKALNNDVFEYLVKSRWSLDAVIDRVKEKLDL